MISYILRRLLATIPVMGVVALFVFSLLYIAPGDPASIIAGDLANEDDIARIREQLGLGEAFPIRFATWVLAVLQGDLGTSMFTNVPVTTLIAQRIEPTLALAGVTLCLTLAIAVPLGVIAAARAGSTFDRGIMIFSVAGYSVPIFVLAYILVFVFSLKLGVAPVQGYKSLSEGVLPFLRHLMLPSLAVAFGLIALVARITRASMLEVLAQDYVRTAKAKGLSESEVLLGHALKNAAVPIATVVGIGFAALISGVVVTETVFGIPGMGKLIVDAILRRDYPVIQGVTLVFSFAYVMVNLAIDLAYTLFDPRIRY